MRRKVLTVSALRIARSSPRTHTRAARGTTTTDRISSQRGGKRVCAQRVGSPLLSCAAAAPCRRGALQPAHYGMPLGSVQQEIERGAQPDRNLPATTLSSSLALAHDECTRAARGSDIHEKAEARAPRRRRGKRTREMKVAIVLEIASIHAIAIHQAERASHIARIFMFDVGSEEVQVPTS